ncbi:MAG: efflux RND transporter periplasmic adaptor subunit [Chromatiales bacterium]|nr:MAG: efflux RND transporter periplasmic adaptor subunit [Chromatiales bacterium]
MNKKLIVALLVLAAGIAAAAWWLQPKPVKVAVVVAERGEVRATVANTRAGTVDACRRAGLSPALGGQMATLNVTEGDAVTKDQVLVELWNEDLKAEVLLAQRDTVAARRRADEVCVRSKVADREAQRLTRLLERGLTSEEEADLAVGDAEAKAAGCKAARETAQVSQAQVDVSKARLERTILRAPFDGVVAEINGELGEFVTPSPLGVATPPTIDLIDDTCLYISAPIDEVDAPAVRKDQLAVVTMDAFADQEFPGVVRRVAPYVLDQEKQARTVEIEVEITGRGDSNLLPGYSADVEVLLETRDDVLRIPTQVLMEGGRVMVLNASGVLEVREVSRGLANWEFTEILDGVSEGERLVLSVDREGVVEGAAAKPE